MKKSKRVTGIWFAAALVVSALCLGGCGSEKEEMEQVEAEDLTQTTADAETEEPAQETETAGSPKGYYFMAGDTLLQADMEFDTVKASLGEEQSVFEAPSCAGDGKDYIYNYVSYEVETYPAEGGVNKIAYIVLKDDTTATPEGIDLSMTKADVIAAYGDGYEEVGDKFCYEKDGTKLNFVFDGDNIISIEYASIVIG